MHQLIRGRCTVGHGNADLMLRDGILGFGMLEMVEGLFASELVDVFKGWKTRPNGVSR